MSILLLFCSCSINNSKKLDDNDIVIIEKIIEELSGKEKIYASTTYVVNPYLNTFEFHPQFTENGSSTYMQNKKKETFDALNIDEEGFEKIKSNINNKYSKEMYSELLDISNADSSNLVYTFSGIGENIVFIELGVLCDGQISKEDLTKKNALTNRKKSELSSIAAIIEGSEIVELIPINAYTKECL